MLSIRQYVDNFVQMWVVENYVPNVVDPWSSLSELKTRPNENYESRGLYESDIAENVALVADFPALNCVKFNWRAVNLVMPTQQGSTNPGWQGYSQGILILTSSQLLHFRWHFPFMPLLYKVVWRTRCRLCNK